MRRKKKIKWSTGNNREDQQLIPGETQDWDKRIMKHERKNRMYQIQA